MECDLALGLLQEQADKLPVGLVECDMALSLLPELIQGLSTGLVELVPGLGLLHVKAQVSLQGLWNVTGFLFPSGAGSDSPCSVAGMAHGSEFPVTAVLCSSYRASGI